MCGIAGSYGSPDAARRVEKMLTMINHRGPDEVGYFYDDHIAFGTARLSIIDVAHGQQPMTTGDGRYWIAYNGEVYNYKELKTELEARGHFFSTHSDTEVALVSYIEWGEKALEKFNGSYAFAIYDTIDQTVFLARDRYGKRPLYYTVADDGALLFASEMKCFLGHGGVQFQYDNDHLASIATLWTVLPDQSGFKGVHQVPPGHWMKVEGKKLTVKPYFELNLNEPPCKASYAEAVEKTRHLLDEAVKLRLRSDVEVGTYLSGGLDSSIVTHLACKNLDRKVRSFSIAFEEKHYDEDSYQREVSQHLGTEHECLTISNDDIAQAFPDSVWHAEVPVFRNAFVPMFLLAQMVKSKGIKVILSGEGSDESFLGYDIFKETKIRRAFSGLSSLEDKEKAISGLYPWMEHLSRTNSRLQVGLFERFSEEKVKNAFSHEIRMHNSKLMLRLLSGFEDSASLPAPIQAYLRVNEKTLSQLSDVKKAQWLEFNTLLHGYLLSSQGDRMSSAHGVETRCPFLDVNVVTWAASLPEDFMLKDGTREKSILKDAFASSLPPRISNRAKQPYRSPDSMVFLSKNRPDYVDALLSDRELAKVQELNNEFVKKFVKSIAAKAPHQISPGEDQAFIFLLSICELNRLFVRKEFSMNSSRNINIVRIDGRASRKKAV